MDVKNVNSYRPYFGAAIFHKDSRIQKFAKQAYHYANKQTDEASAKIRSMDSSTMVMLSLGEKDSKQVMIARNPKTKVNEYLEISNPNHVELEDRFAYLEMLRKLGDLTLNSTRKFWGIK